MSLIFKAFVLCIFTYCGNAQDTQIDKNFENQILSNISNTLNSNESDTKKLQNIKKQLINVNQTQKTQKKKYHFNLMTHHENFLLFAGHSSTHLVQKHWDSSGNRDLKNEYTRDSNEAQFQISFKIPLVSDIFESKADLFVAYTQQSFWQVYDSKHSSPFRETNYMPELFLQWQPNIKISDAILKKVRLSLIHQSNGQGIGDSRSWNRTQLHLLFKQGNISYGADIWERWKEGKKSNFSESEGDDNPDLEHYIGKQKYFIQYKINNYKLSLSHQNNLFNYNSAKGNTKLDFSFPSMNKHFDFFIRYFHGYGESLIDYDIKINRISFGVILANWN